MTSSFGAAGEVAVDPSDADADGAARIHDARDDPCHEATTITEKRSTTDGLDDPTRSLDRGYEWTCPFCGTSRLNRVSDEGDREHAQAALRAHVHSSEDDDHGPADAFPPGFDGAAIDDHVVFRE